MNIVLLQVELDLVELNQLSREFPQFVFLSFPRHAHQPISKEHWQRAEIFFGEKLSIEDLNVAENLRWIHTPTSNIHRLCLKEIEKRGNILISSTREENNLFQMGEYVLGSVLAFAKNLFIWKEMMLHPAQAWDSRWRNKMWTLKDKIFLQIGMGKIGEEISRRAQEACMQVWGMDVKRRSFHPYCKKQLTIQELHEVLPQVDVVSLALPIEQGLLLKLGPEELDLMKQDSILCLLGSRKQIDENALASLSKKGKFRGIILDAYFHSPIPPSSQLWHTPYLLLTPEIASRPKEAKNEAFRIFRFNLRQFLHGNFSDMKNLIDPSIALVPDMDEQTF